MTTVAVTGATGFIGASVVRRLVARGDRVFAFGGREASDLAKLSGVTYRQWRLPSELGDCPRVEAVVHCAGTVTDWSSESLFDRVNVEGTRCVLRAFRDASRFVHVSTASVYDPWKPWQHIQEDVPYPQRYLNKYARSKMLAEVAVREVRPDAVILRPHAVYGRGDQKLLPRLFEARWFGWQMAVGDGRNRISITHVGNLVHAVERSIDASVSGTFNIADLAEPTVDELLRQILSAAGLQPRIAYVPTAAAWPLGQAMEVVWSVFGLSHPPRLTRYVVSQLSHEGTLDLSAARARLGYAPTVAYAEGIRDALS